MAANPWKLLFKYVTKSGDRSARAKGNVTGTRYPVSINWQDLEAQFDLQNHLCYWLQVPLDPLGIFIPYNPMAISVDRLDNDRGYDRENIVIVCRGINLFRGKCDAESFREIIKQIKQ